MVGWIFPSTHVKLSTLMCGNSRIIPSKDYVKGVEVDLLTLISCRVTRFRVWCRDATRNEH